ncbi:protein furry-like isoform X4 [Portunus trituberculatus]|uniref:protein furry-like isoform X4 n=1 Tax=Portunus trituberculatus TaxID=210409 RepID=UPI001E1CC67B|nr:protein furry-like isoform X4 [Portunus trituberculatus]
MKRTKTLPSNLRRPLVITRANSGNNNTNNNNNNSASTTPGAGEDTVSLYTYRLHVGTTQTIELTLHNPPQSPSRGSNQRTKDDHSSLTSHGSSSPSLHSSGAEGSSPILSPSIGRRIVAPGVAVFKKLLLDRLTSNKQDGEEVGERGPGDGREAGQDELLEIPSDDENETTPALTLDVATDPTMDRSLSASHEVGGESVSGGSGSSAGGSSSGSSGISGSSSGSGTGQAGGTGAGVGGGASTLLPWGAHKERAQFPATVHIDTDLRPGEFVMRTLFAEFTVMAERKIECVMLEPLERSLSKSLQRGEDPTFDQLLLAFGCVAEHCLPSLLHTLFAWYDRQGVEWGATDSRYRHDPSKGKGGEAGWSVERETVQERRDLAVEFIFCLVLIEVLRQLAVHPGHDDLVKHIEDVAFKHFKYREGVQNNPNGENINTISDLYAEVVGVLAQSRFQSVRRRFMAELKELRAREQSTVTTQTIMSLLMGMKFFRVKMVPIEEFEASFQFMQECAQYFLEVRDKDIKHALAGLFVEILVPVAAAVKNEVNVPCLKYFVEMLYSTTQDMATKNKHRLAIFPLVTCLLCVSQKAFFLTNWHYFLAMCLQHLKNRDPKMSRVALESLYRLLWVYMIRIKCESNSATHSRLASIVNSLFPKGSKAVVPRDTPLNIFVKIIQFIAQERLDFAMREIVFDLLSVGRQIKIILTPERMSIGLRAFLVVADSLQQKEGDPPMPRTVGVLPSGNTLRVKKTFLNKMLTEDMARNIGISAYYPLVRKSFNDILKALDSQFGRPLMMTNTQNVNKEPDEMITGERKPKIDLFRTCVAAVPRLIPDGMSGRDLVDLLARLTVHMDEELRHLAFQSLQNLVLDFPEWRHDVLFGFIQFLMKEVGDSYTQLLDNGVRMLLQLLTAWKNALTNTSGTGSGSGPGSGSSKRDPGVGDLHHLHLHQRGDHTDVLRLAEGFSMVLLCSCRQAPRRVSVAIMREVKMLAKALGEEDPLNRPLIDVMDEWCGVVVEGVLTLLPPGERSAIAATTSIDLQWLADRSSSVWTGGFVEESGMKSVSQQHLVSEDVWALVLCGFVVPGRVLTDCPQAVSHAWPIVYTRATSLYSLVDPTPPNDNRASLLRSATQVKKPISERDVYMNLWRNYVVLACRVVPAITKTPIVRCASPDISLGSSPDSGAGGGGDRGGERPYPGYSVSPTCLYKLLVPLLRCDATDMREAVTLALGKINHIALSDLMEEIFPYIRESIDRKQENMRRRRRRDALRLTLVKLFQMIAEQGTFPLSERVLEGDTGALRKRYLEYVEGARQYLEGETDKDNTLLQIKTHFCEFVRKLIATFSLEQRQTLLPRSLRKSLFYLFTSWSGIFGVPFGFKAGDTGRSGSSSSGGSVAQPSEFELCAVQAASSVLCCGPAFDPQLLADEAPVYQWLDALLGSHDEKVKKKIYALAQETIVLLLEFNPDSGAVLDWVVDRCYTAAPEVADGCFNALATIFSAREYPCDHYTAIMNVTLLNTGCPRACIHETALQLLQVLDKRFFGAVTPLVGEGEERRESSTLDVLLSSTYSRSQLYLSKQLAHLHPELTMPMFSEVSYRLQTARCAVRQLLLHYLLPWLYNMELVDPSTPPAAPPHAPHYCQYYGDEGRGSNLRREGWGSAEATEMVLNNLFYITAKLGEDHPKEVEELWAALCTCWPNNLRVIIRYLFIITGMAAAELLPYAKRVIVYVARARPERLVEELMAEMGTVETLNCVIERTETPPFFRLTSMRKTSSHGEGGGVGGSGTGQQEQAGSERGTLHTKRHSGDHHDLPRERYSPLVSREQRSAPGSLRSVSSVGSGVSSVIAVDGAAPAAATTTTTKSRPNSSQSPNLPEDTVGTVEGATTPQKDNFAILRAQSSGAAGTGGGAGAGDDQGERYDPPQPHPLPMPEYGGYFAPLTEYLPDSSQPITAFHRCNVAVMLLCDVIVAGIDVDCHSVDWSIHVPLMLHIITLGLDHSRPLVHTHCKTLLVHLLTVVGDHRDHLGVARVLLNNKTTQLGYGLVPNNVFTHSKNFTEEPPSDPVPPIVAAPPGFENPPDTTSEARETVETLTTTVVTITTATTVTTTATTTTTTQGDVGTSVAGSAGVSGGPTEDSVPQPVIVTSEDTADTVSASSAATGPEQPPRDDLQHSIMALIDFIASSKNQPLWPYEDITSKQFSIRSADQLANFVRHVVTVFGQSLPHTHIEERWAQIALHLALSCSSRHYAGRSLQVFRSLHVSMSSRMLSDLLGRLVETVAEQGDDMQGYVTELMLTLEAAVDALDSDFRPIEFVRELFKSTPNLNNKDRKSALGYGMMGHFYGSAFPPPSAPMSPSGHIRSTSYSISYGRGKPMASPTAELKVQPEMRGRSGTDVDTRMRQQQQQQMTQQLQQSTNLSRSRSAQSLKQLADQSSSDDKMTVLAQLFWIAVSVLESDYEYEFILAMRLLDKVLARLPLDRPDCRDKVEKLQQQLKWRDFPGVHALLLKGCTCATTYEATITLLSRFTQLTDLQVVDPSQSRAFAINVIALLPYMLQNYEDDNPLCIQAAENVAQVCNEKGKQLENLATVMTLYSRRNFSKESFQWTKCVVKYLHDSYAHLSLSLMAFLVEVLEKGPTTVQNPILNILHCMLHYIDINTAAAQLVNGDLLRVIAKYIEGSHWKEALRILKMAVTRSSSLVVPPASSHTHYWDHHIFTDIETHFKKELPGRTMEFTFDVTQTPIVGRRFLRGGAGPGISIGQISAGSSTVSSATSDSLREREQDVASSEGGTSLGVEPGGPGSASPHRSLSLSAADTSHLAGWKTPWLSQARVREALVNLLNTCGQRVGLPKSPSVIFSQSSELERQSSMASSTEEVSVAPGDTNNDRTADDMTSSEKQFAVFKDFDFLEYELESQGEESVDNFNLWGVRRRSPSNLEEGDISSHLEDAQSTDLISSHTKKVTPPADNEWWEEEGSVSPVDDPSLGGSERSSGSRHSSSSTSLHRHSHHHTLHHLHHHHHHHQPPAVSTAASTSVSAPTSKLTLDTSVRRPASPTSISDESSDGDLGDMTPCNASPSITAMLFRPIRQPNDLEDTWRSHLLSLIATDAPIVQPNRTCTLFSTVFSESVMKFSELIGESIQYLSEGGEMNHAYVSFLPHMEGVAGTAPLPYVFVDSMLLNLTQLTPRFRSTFIALHEHLDTYLDKRDSANRCLDSIKSTVKLQNLGESLPELCPDEQHTDLCRCLYKLHFQLSLLYDTYAKLLLVMLQAAHTTQASDHSVELSTLQGKLVTAAEQLDSTPPTTPTRSTHSLPPERELPEGEEGECESVGGEESEGGSACESSLGRTEGGSPVSSSSLGSQSLELPVVPPASQPEAELQLLQLVADQRWVGALQFVRQHRALWPREASSAHDDITIILNTYCTYLADKKPGMIAVCGTEGELQDTISRLMDINMSAHSALRVIEQTPHQVRDSLDSVIRKTEC